MSVVICIQDGTLIFHMLSVSYRFLVFLWIYLYTCFSLVQYSCTYFISFILFLYIPGTKYGAVMFDMDSKDGSVGLSCPPRQFLEDHVLDEVKKILTDDGEFLCEHLFFSSSNSSLYRTLWTLYMPQKSR